ncbi:MAG: hypothetical protein JEZ01_02100 [Labilibaculum sp.]|nr:hypothetical protein [Labilibaculum sp.]MBI9056543.1 hypothetical protein [Labilibaculum sp.]
MGGNKKKKKVQNNRSKKHNTKQLGLRKRVKIAFILIGLFSPLFVYIFFKNQERKELLENDSFQTVAFIEYLKPRQRKGINGSVDVIYFKFIHGDTVVHSIKQTMAGRISSKAIKIGNAYELTVVNSDNDIFKLNIDKRIDSCYSNVGVKCHKYKSERHKQNIKNKR